MKWLVMKRPDISSPTKWRSPPFSILQIAPTSYSKTLVNTKVKAFYLRVDVSDVPVAQDTEDLQSDVLFFILHSTCLRFSKQFPEIRYLYSLNFSETFSQRSVEL